MTAKSGSESEKLRDGNSGASICGASRLGSDGDPGTGVGTIDEPGVASKRCMPGETVRFDSVDADGRLSLLNAVAACNESANELDLGGVFDFRSS